MVASFEHTVVVDSTLHHSAEGNADLERNGVV